MIKTYIGYTKVGLNATVFEGGGSDQPFGIHLLENMISRLPTSEISFV